VERPNRASLGEPDPRQVKCGAGHRKLGPGCAAQPAQHDREGASHGFVAGHLRLQRDHAVEHGDGEEQVRDDGLERPLRLGGRADGSEEPGRVELQAADRDQKVLDEVVTGVGGGVLPDANGGSARF
jgi:hypothetical protein